jgi:hypothetical protein
MPRCNDTIFDDPTILALLNDINTKLINTINCKVYFLENYNRYEILPQQLFLFIFRPLLNHNHRFEILVNEIYH